jgi:hypothetical protein
MTIEQINNHQLIATKEQIENMTGLAGLVTQLEQSFGKPFQVTSGLRTPQLQMQINPSIKKSAHLTGEAVDVSDSDGKIYDFCISNVDILIRLGLYLESRTYTPRWAHITCRAPASGNRFFIP